MRKYEEYDPDNDPNGAYGIFLAEAEFKRRGMDAFKQDSVEDPLKMALQSLKDQMDLESKVTEE